MNLKKKTVRVLYLSCDAEKIGSSDFFIKTLFLYCSFRISLLGGLDLKFTIIPQKYDKHFYSHFAWHIFYFDFYVY